MTNEPPLEKTRRELRKKLIDDLFAVINDSKIDVGFGIDQADVVGALEWVKLWYVKECFDSEDS